MTVLGKIRDLWRYPISSTGGERLDALDIDVGGVHGDRTWGVVNLRTGEVAGPERRRHWRPLPNIHSRLNGGHPELANGDGRWFPAGSPEADALLSSFLGFPAALRRHVPFETQKEGYVAPRYDRADLHLLTTASLRTLAGQLGFAQDVDCRRFRPNIVIETGAGFEGFAEHTLIGRHLVIRNVEIEISEPCARCAFTALAQGDLAFKPEVLHKIAANGGGFGILCTVARGGHLAVGDTVRIIQD